MVIQFVSGLKLNVKDVLGMKCSVISSKPKLSLAGGNRREGIAQEKREELSSFLCFSLLELPGQIGYEMYTHVRLGPL
jgi:hypothetical protein